MLLVLQQQCRVATLTIPNHFSPKASWSNLQSYNVPLSDILSCFLHVVQFQRYFFCSGILKVDCLNEASSWDAVMPPDVCQDVAPHRRHLHRHTTAQLWQLILVIMCSGESCGGYCW